MLRHLDLFSGIGGFALGLRMASGFETVGFCEIDPFCQRVLRKHWPEVPIYGDIRELPTNEFMGVDIITGGFPCQPFSVAGNQRGAEDDRHLWPEMFRVIKEVRPTWVLSENVFGFINMELDNTLSDLESEGYSCQTFIIPALAVDAKHRRDRVWIVAYAECTRRQSREIYSRNNIQTPSGKKANTLVSASEGQQTMANHDSIHVQRSHYRQGQEKSQRSCRWEPEPCVDRVAHGVSNRVDRLKGLGNAVVPQIVAEFGYMIHQASMYGESR